MRNKNWVLSSLLLLPILMATGCSGKDTATLANEMSFPLDGISEVKIAYDKEGITYYQGDSDQLVVKEYMNVNKSNYYAKVTELDGAIHISEGGKPLRHGNFYRYVEVYLPAGYGETLITASNSGDIDLTGLDIAVGAFYVDSTSGKIKIGAVTADSVRLTTTSGEIDCGALSGTAYLETKSGAISVQSVDATGGVFEAHTTSGSYKLGSVDADQVVIRSTSGTVECEEMLGQISYITTSGDLQIGSATGSGSFDASNSGELDVTFSQVTGDLSLFNKNGGINLVLPTGLSFHFQGTTRNGSIDTTFDSQLSVDGDSLTGDVGSDPTITVKVETREGNITAAQ